MIKDIIKKSLADEELNPEEIASLFKAPLFSKDSALIQQASRQKSQKASNNTAEVHAQLGLNLAPCPRNCKFCAFAAENGIFQESHRLTPQEAISRAKRFEFDGANAIFLMGTADYPFSKFIEMGKEIKNNLAAETILIANVGDFNKKEAKQLKNAGFSGIYHAIRLGEGRDSTISPNQRRETFKNTKEAGLLLGTCLEPVGPEHTIEELVEKTIITRDAEPTYSGAARRIPIPNTELAKYGIVSEAKMAHILAVVRLALGAQVPGNCTHEPNVIGAAAGANLFWSESGSNPRDTEEDTEGKRGLTVSECRDVFTESEWDVLKGPSKFYQDSLLKEGV